jgi:hypothetical protein
MKRNRNTKVHNNNVLSSLILNWVLLIYRQLSLLLAMCTLFVSVTLKINYIFLISYYEKKNHPNFFVLNAHNGVFALLFDILVSLGDAQIK